MNFQQLRIIRETARRNYNLTEVANALFTSQSGVSKHIKDLEDELGVELFIRRGKRLLGMTDPGKELLGIVERMLLDAGNIRSLADQFSKQNEGGLVVATTHTQARYVLPPIVSRFMAEFPKVHLTLYQGSPKEIVAMLNAGEADVGIATEALQAEASLVSFPFYTWHHAVVAPDGHPLTRATDLSLARLTEYPIITYHPDYTGRNRIDETFAKAGLVADVVMSALDADVIKTYVALGLGIGIIAEMAYVPDHEQGLQRLPTGNLFPANTTRIAIRRGHYLRGYVYRFLEKCCPDLTEAAIRDAVSPTRDADLV